MRSPISFGGKCLTVLIGAALSWITIAYPEVDHAVGSVLGTQQDRIEQGKTDNFADVDSLTTSSLAASPLTPQSLTDALPDVGSLVNTVVTQQTTNSSEGIAHASSRSSRSVTAPPEPQFAAGSSNRSESRTEEIAAQLKSLGASYVLLERLPQAASDQYRARCDLAGNGNAVKCCFEVVRSTPNQAMEDVLREVISRRKDSANARFTNVPDSPPI